MVRRRYRDQNAKVDEDVYKEQLRQVRVLVVARSRGWRVRRASRCRVGGVRGSGVRVPVRPSTRPCAYVCARVRRGAVRGEMR